MLVWAAVWLGARGVALASEHHGQVVFGGVPVPGVVVTAEQGGKKFVAVTNQLGVYSFPDLADGRWTISTEMMCFEPIRQEVMVAPGGPGAAWEIKLLPLDQIRLALKPGVGTITTAQQAKGVPAAGPEAVPEEVAQKAADGMLINGSVNNAATSKFSLTQAFGNNRNGSKSLYNGGLTMVLDNSALDARPYSLSGAQTPKAAYDRFTGTFTFGGPIKIPRLIPRGPNFTVVYQWTRNRDATTQSALVPTLFERAGDFSQETTPVTVYDSTGQPFPGDVIPVLSQSAQAQALLSLYPLPNLVGDPRYNFQIPIVSNLHQDALQTRLNKQIGRKDNVFGGFAYQSVRSDAPNLFSFVDSTKVLGMNTDANWSHRFNPRVGLNLGYRFSRLSTRVTPYWENRSNFSEDAKINGNAQDAMNWGPPTLQFSFGLAGLTDGIAAFNRNRTDQLTVAMHWQHRGHNVEFGGDFRRQEYNYLTQQNPRGTFKFDGTATRAKGATTGGSDFADFLLGVPDTSALNTGNPDKYLRESVYDAFATDDWRVSPSFTLNAGVRWEYGAPITELKDRLANLDVLSGFAAVTPVLASSPIGPLTGQHYPDSLLRADRSMVEPRIGLSWRPIPGSSLVIRAGYGVYADSSVYQSTALQLAQQAPLSKSLSVQNSAACPLTLANGFNPCSTTTSTTFAVDPNFRVGYAQTWQASAQKDLPGSLQGTITYLGIKGTRGNQEFYPNSYPVGAVNPCPLCPVGFAYLTSNGNSTRESVQVQMRRRLHNGLTASVGYTYSKSIDDDAALGGQGPVAPGAVSASASNFAVAQDWRNLRGERALSTFDQRHLLNVTAQYTTGMGIGGHSLMGGWKGAAYKEWTLQTAIVAGSGLPESPVYPFTLPGTGYTGNLRPNTTGVSVKTAPAGYFLNQAAYAAPVVGQWGTAGRNSITGPGQFSLNASAGRTFRLSTRYSMDVRVDATNVLNKVTYSSWNTIFGNTQFGLPLGTSGMRSLQTTARVRF